MEWDTRVFPTSTVLHSCVLHDDGRISVCSGTLRNGRNCVNKATNTGVSGVMPTCKIHRDQQKKSGWCRAPLSCGFECGRLFEWKPHGFQLCSGHRQNLTTCYFLTIPKELRLRVFQFLLPDRRIPAQRRVSRAVITDGEGAWTAILRANKLIHDEATSLLYSTSVFTIQVSGLGLTMCKSASSSAYKFSIHGNHALQDYQMQLMLLEQQNKKRRMMANGEQCNMSLGSSSTNTPAIRDTQPPNRSHVPYTDGPIETHWHPPISARCFDMIRSFLIEISFPAPRQPVNTVTRRAHGLSNADVANHKVLELRLYDYCDDLHKLIERLQLIQRPIAHLNIIIKFGDTYVEREEALSAAQILLRPFRRLCNVATPDVISITMDDDLGQETELLTPDRVPGPANSNFDDYLKCWSRDLSSSQPSCECPQVYEAFWKLSQLLSTVREHGYHAEPMFSQFSGLLHAARVAREAEDLSRFKETWDQVVNIWLDYLNERKNFQSNVARSIDAIYDIVGNNSEASGSRGGADP